MVGLGNKIRILRYRKGWSQEILAQKLGISIPFLTQIENDEIDLFYNLLKKIADIFSVPAYFLLSNEMEREEQKTELEKTEVKIAEYEQYIDELKMQLSNLKSAI